MAGKVISGDDPNDARQHRPQHRARRCSAPTATRSTGASSSFQTTGKSLYNTHAYYLGDATTMVYTNDCVGGISASNASLRCIANPQRGNGFDYITYEPAATTPTSTTCSTRRRRRPALYGVGAGGQLSRLHLQRRHDAGRLGRTSPAAFGGLGLHPDRRRLAADRPRRCRARSGSGAAGATATTSPATARSTSGAGRSAGHFNNLITLLGNETPG